MFNPHLVSFNVHTISTGSPLDNCAVYLLDEDMNPAREHAPGQLWVAGGCLAAGYVGGLGAASFCDNPHAKHPGELRNVSIL